MPGYVLASLLAAEGVEVGAVAAGGAGVTRRLTYVASAPLSTLVRELGKNSDNFTAEMLLKALDPDGDAPKTSAAGAAAIAAWLRGIGAFGDGTRVRNGSGLFDANRLSARTLTRVLAYAHRSSKIGPDFVAQLAIGGVDGTLRSRFREHRGDRAIRAKTGTLNSVIALSGYVLGDANRGPIAFSFIVDGIRGKHAGIRQKIDSIVDEIAKRSSAS
jgi:D-alanyl-D-alanine carboxypeptidase/D-alanyl-D-alanine-endopeptidase (penicillin-binding protein 4)